MKKINLFIVIILIISVIGTIFVFFNANKSKTAIIKKDGEVIRRVDLTVDESFVVGDGSSTNTVVVQDGKIFVSGATCPDGVCIKHGPLKNNQSPIVCLPHKLIILFED